MAVFAWISLQMKICKLYTTKFYINKQKSKQTFLGGREGAKSKKIAIFSIKHEKRDFTLKMAKKNWGKHVSSVKNTDIIH